MDDWWVLGTSGEPVGPVTSDLVVQGIKAGVIPGDSMVCVVGGNRWEAIRDVPLFCGAFTELLSSPHIPQIHGKGKARRFIDGEDATMVDAAPFFAEPSTLGGEAPPTIPPRLGMFDDVEEPTIVELLPPRPSEPP